MLTNNKSPWLQTAQNLVNLLEKQPNEIQLAIKQISRRQYPTSDGSCTRVSEAKVSPSNLPTNLSPSSLNHLN
jgi:hypothetical protein